MIDLKKLPEFPGFTVYDAETGDPIDAEKELPNEAITGCLFLGEDGELLVDGICGSEMMALPKGKYIIQLGTGEMYRW